MSSPTKTVTVLLIGPSGFVHGAESSKVPGVRFLSASNPEEFRAAAEQGPIDHVVVGAVDLETKMMILRSTDKWSPGTTIHIDSAASGADGFPNFIKGLWSLESQLR